MSPHEAAQSVVWFVVLVFVGIGVVLWFDYRKEKEKPNPENYIFDPMKHSSKFVAPRALNIANKLRKGENDGL